MSLFSNKNDDKDNKISKKDIIIIVLSVLSLALLGGIIFASRNTDRTITQQLLTDSRNGVESADVDEKSVDITGALLISEVSSSGFIELYNASSGEYDLNGCKVFLAGKEIMTVSENVTVGNENYAVIEIGTNPGVMANTILTIQNAEGKTIETIMLPQIPDGKSYGLVDISSYDMAFMDETKGEVNKADVTPVYATYSGIGFSVPGGFYSSDFKLTLTSDDGNKIYYTTDGTEPTTDSEVYSAPINIKNKSGQNYVYGKMAIESSSGVYFPGRIDKGVVVRALLVDAGGNVISKATQSYYPGLLRDSAYVNIPAISLTVNPEDMFDYFNGIYVSGRSREDSIAAGGNGQGAGNYYNGWSRNARIEYFEPDKGKSFEKDVQVKILVDESITDRQKGLTITVDDGEGASFDGSSILKYLSNDNSLTLYQNYEDNNAKVRALLINKLMEGSNVGTAEYSPVSLFIDGEYWGLYMMKAPFDEAYIERNYGVKDQEIYFHTYGTFEEDFTQLREFVENNDMSISENYAQAEKMMDMDSYLEYVCMNMFVANTYYGSLRTTQWRTKDVTSQQYCDGKWRWLVGRVDTTLLNTSSQSYSIDTFLTEGFTKDKFLQSLLMNKTFCDKLYSTMESLVNDRLTSEKAEPVLNELKKLLEKPVASSRQRFYGNIDGLFDSEASVIRDFFNNRKDYIMIYTKETAERGGDLSFVEEEEALAEENAEDLLTDENEENPEADDNAREEAEQQTDDRSDIEGN